MASAQELLKRISSQKEKRKSATIAEDIENNNVKPKVIKKKSGSRHPWDQMTPLHKAVQQKNETADEPEIQIIQKDISGLSDNKKMKKNKNLKTKTSKG